MRDDCGKSGTDNVAAGGEENAIEFSFCSARLAHGDGRSLIERITVDAATDRRKRDRANVMLTPELERRAIARREQGRLTVHPAAPDWTNRVNHVPRAQIESGCDAALAGRTPHVRPDFRNRQTRFVELRAGRPMNGAVDATAAKHPLVRGVDDGVNVELRDVAANNLDQGRNRGRATGRPGHGMEIIISTSAIP